jgi:hypothetical protein
MKKRMSNNAKTSPQTIEAKTRAAKALELRKEGRTFEQIAVEAGYSCKQSAYDAVKRAILEIIREPAEEVLKIDLERLDAIWQIPYLNAQSGDVNAVNTCLKIMERRARLLGLDTRVVDFKSTDGSMSTRGALDPSKLSTEVMAEILAAKDAAERE